MPNLVTRCAAVAALRATAEEQDRSADQLIRDNRNIFRESIRFRRRADTNGEALADFRFPSPQPAQFYRAGLAKLPDRWRTRIDRGGDYVE